MPELPEVETIRRELESRLKGRRIQTLYILRRDIISQPSPQTFRHHLVGLVFQDLDRRGKFLLLRLSSGEILAVHLGMSGALYLKRPNDPLAKHTHLRLFLDDGSELRYVDPRRFGRIYLAKSAEQVVGSLGPEPLGDGFSPQDLSKLLEKRKGMLKPLLMDQRFLAGLGNIYSDEALFLARVHPRRRVDTLSRKDISRLHRAIRQVLQEGLAHLGSSLDGSYRRPDEGQGQHQEHFRVFRRSGEPCVRCATPIARIVLGGRSTHFCPHCQK